MLNTKSAATDKNYVVMDLEFNYPNTAFRSTKNNIRLGAEIIEIGAVKLDSNLRETDRYSGYVRPKVYTKMNGKVRELTHITTEMIHNARPFEEAIPDFLSWCGDADFLTWSENDIFVLEDNMLYNGMEIKDLPECYDVQLMFDDQVMQEGRRFALNYAAWKLGIETEPCHAALNDAVNTAAILRKIDLPAGFTGYEV